jgi:hypothetical protein
VCSAEHTICAFCLFFGCGEDMFRVCRGIQA